MGAPGHNPALIRQMQLSKHKLKATSRTSALLAGFAMVSYYPLFWDWLELSGKIAEKGDNSNFCHCHGHGQSHNSDFKIQT